jgi:hypothetical protein
MSTRLKLLTGFAAALLTGWLSHGPLGQGEAFVSALEAQARAELQQAEMPQVQVRMKRDPLQRVAILSGPANDFQREGQGYFPGINDRIGGVPGIAGFEWANPPTQGN